MTEVTLPCFARHVPAAPEDGKSNRTVTNLLVSWLGEILGELIAGHSHAEKTVIAGSAIKLPPLP